MKKEQELIVITKTYDLILWSCNHTGKFPRNHRFVLGERIERSLYSLLETLIRARYTKQRQRLLEEANLTLEILRFQMRLAKDLQCLKVNSTPVRRGSPDPAVLGTEGLLSWDRATTLFGAGLGRPQGDPVVHTIEGLPVWNRVDHPWNDTGSLAMGPSIS
jgi:hypothetical protein